MEGKLCEKRREREGGVRREFRMLDLFCGRWGWSRAFAARGWECVGVDLVEPQEIPTGCEFVKMDALDVLWLPVYQGFRLFRSGGNVCNFDFICASSPCEKFSVFQIKNFHPDPPYPEIGVRLFNHTREICEASEIPYIIENVRAAERFVGRATNHSGSFYLWGTAVPPLLPKGLSKGMKMDRKWCQELGGHGTAKRDSQTAGFATIPPELAGCVADYATRICSERVTI